MSDKSIEDAIYNLMVNDETGDLQPKVNKVQSNVILLSQMRS